MPSRIGSDVLSSEEGALAVNGTKKVIAGSEAPPPAALSVSCCEEPNQCYLMYLRSFFF